VSDPPAQPIPGAPRQPPGQVPGAPGGEGHGGPPGQVSSGGHLGDGLSALVDGELGLPDEARALEHLAGCPQCAAELEWTTRARALLRALPLAEPPVGYPDTVVRRIARPGGRRPAAALAGVAAAAAAVLLTLSARSGPVTPPVDRFVQAHATSPASGDPITEMAPVAVPVSIRR